jgi:predicted outer membrane repeat protein
MLINITLLKNTGAHGGGLNCWGASPILTNVTFSKNQSETAGGGIYCEESSPTLTNVTFLENTAIWGGGMSCDSSPTLNNCTFSKNQAASGGGMYCTSDHATLTDCTFSLNWAWSDGGGMECWDSFSTLSNCTFFGNSSTYLWGIIYCGAGSCVTLLNTIIAFSTQGGAIGCDGASTASLTYCNVYGNAGGDWVACIAGQNTIPGNISCNPKFCYPDTGNFHLAENSCCVGAGCDSLGNPDTTIDIGAFEVDCSSLLPGPFSLLFPPSKAFTPRRVRLDWETATYPDTFDQVKYDLYISTSYRFHPDSTIIDSNLVPSEMVKNLDYGAHYWKVKAKDNGGGERWSNQIRYFMVTGIHYSGDFNGDGSTDVGDVVFAINYLYKSGSAPDPLDLGDTNCDGVVNAADVVYLINYLFIGGPPPCEP